MAERSDHIAMPVSDAQARSTTWAAYAASAWAFLFAAMSFYWAAGGTAGINTIVDNIEDLGLAGNPWIVAGTGLLKVLAGLLALALVRPWGRLIPRRMLLIATWSAGALLVLYGGTNLIQHGLMVTGVISIPEALGGTPARWHLMFWDPWWLLGGILFVAATWSYMRKPRD